MDNVGLNKNYIRFGLLVAVVIVINLGFYYRTKLYPSTKYVAEIKNTNFNEIENIRNQFEKKNIIENNTKLPVKPSVFCIIKTHPENIAKNKTLTVLNVWGRKCDNYR